MEGYIIHCKTTEYLSRYCVVSRMGNQEKARKLALMTLVTLRQEARAAHMKSESLWSEVRWMRRFMKKIKAADMDFPLGKMRVKKLESDMEAAMKELARVGEMLYLMLDLWQMSGASFEDLCNLCNRDPDQVRKELLESESTESPFSGLAMVHNLDYKDPRDTGWLQDSIDAPLTHALKAYMLDTILHTEAGRKASREAMNAVFPEIMENALTVVTDEDGIRHLIDRDGVEIGTMDPDGGGVRNRECYWSTA